MKIITGISGITLAASILALSSCRLPESVVVAPIYDSSNDPLGFHRTLAKHRRGGIVSTRQVRQVVRQQREFERRRAEIEKEHPGRVVALAGGELFVGDSPAEVMRSVDSKRPGALVYMEAEGSWIYGQPFTQNSLDNRLEGWAALEDPATGNFDQLRRQRDAVDSLPPPVGDAGSVWRAVVDGRAYSARHRMELVERVRADFPHRLIYCSAPDRGQWDIVPTWAGYGQSFMDYRSMMATMVKVSFGGGKEASSRLLKVDSFGLATPISVLDWNDVVGLSPGYRGVLVSNVYPYATKGAVGLVDDLQLQTRIGEEEATWRPGLVLVRDRSALGVDFLEDVWVWASPPSSSDGTGLGVATFEWEARPARDE